MTRFMTAVLALLFGASASAQEYTGLPDFEGTTVSGRVVWPGEAPSPVLLRAAKNAETCCGQAVADCEKDSDRLHVHPLNRGVANCVVFLADFDLSTPGKTFPDGGAIDQKGCHYVPHIAFVRVGEKLSISNSDDILHNVHGYLDNDTVFNLAMPLPAKTKQKLKKPGRVELRCDAGHTWMTGWIWVIEHPYYATTDEDGRFELSGVPDGAYSLVVWHEGWEILETLRATTGEITGYIFREPLELTPIDVVVDRGKVEGVPDEIVLQR